MPHPHLSLCFNFTHFYLCVKLWTSMCQRCWCSPTQHTTIQWMNGVNLKIIPEEHPPRPPRVLCTVHAQKLCAQKLRACCVCRMATPKNTPCMPPHPSFLKPWIYPWVINGRKTNRGSRLYGKFAITQFHSSLVPRLFFSFCISSYGR